VIPHSIPDDRPRHFQLIEYLGPPPVRDPSVNFRVLHVLVPQVILDELEALAVVQEMNGDTVPEAVNPHVFL